jgi:hypothetical protein
MALLFFFLTLQVAQLTVENFDLKAKLKAYEGRFGSEIEANNTEVQS